MKMSPVVMATVVLVSGLVFAQGRPKAEVTPLVDADGAHAGSTVRIALRVSLPDGVHVHSDKPRDPVLIPTVLTIDPPSGVAVDEIVYPEPAEFRQAGQKVPLAVFEQRFVVGLKLTLERSLGVGEVVVPGHFGYQACNASTCFAPVREETRWVLTIVPTSTSVKERSAEVFDRIRFRR